MVGMSRSYNLDTSEDETSRGIKKQKYPLDDYLINTNMQTRTQASLLSPISPVSSPETVDVLQNAERLVQSAQKQIMEVNFNSAPNTLDDNSSSYIGQQPLDDSLLYIREIVNSKFQESNDPSGTHIRKALTNNVISSNRKLLQNQFPVKESTGMLSKPLEISEQNSEISKRQFGKGIFLHNEKPFFKKAPNWFKINPSEHINVFPTSTTCNLRSKTKSSCMVPRCTMTNTGVIEINGKDHLDSTIQVQTGPTVDIRRGLTIQTIENVHISPDPSSVPIYNNIATYCFQHEPSTSISFADSNKTHIDKHSIASFSARNVFDIRKERHIQSTDYNEMDKIVHIENTHNGTTVVKDSINPSHDTNQNTIATQAILTNNNNNNSNNDSNSSKNNVNPNEIDLRSAKNELLTDDNVIEGSELRNSSIPIRESVVNVTENTYLNKAVGLNLTPIKTTVTEELPVTDAEVETENKEEDFEGKSNSKDYHEVSSIMEFVSSCGSKKIRRMQLDNDYVERLQVCGDECKTGSCSRKCERDIKYREKQRLKEALETIANIEKLRFDIKDTGIVPKECTQICEDKNHCNADAINFEFEPFSHPEHFKIALENLCKFSQNTKASKIDTNSKMYQEAIDGFVQMFFDSNNQSNPTRGLYSPNQNLDNTDTVLRQNTQSPESNGTFEKTGVKMKKEEMAKAPQQVKLILEPNKMEYRQQPIKIVNPKVNNVAVNNLSTIKNNTSSSPISQFRTGQPNKCPRPLAPQNSQSLKGKVARQAKTLSEITSNKQENNLKNLDLKQPCVSDVDAVLKTYNETMVAIHRGTEQLSQLISHHIMKNGLSASDQISSSPIPVFEAREAPNKKFSAEPVVNVSDRYSKIPEQFASIYQKNSTDQPAIQTCSNQIKSTEVTQQKCTRYNYPNSSRDDVEFSNENNSVCINGIPVSTENECLSTCSKSLSEEAKTLSNTDEKFSSAQLNVPNDTSNPTSTSKLYHQDPVNIRTHLAPTQHRAPKNVRKSGETQFMNIQYCIAEPLEARIPIEVTSDKKSSPSQSSLSTYLHLENACGKDLKINRHSNYDIHSDQTGDFNLYKCPVFISGQRDSFDTLNNNSNEKLALAENNVQTKEIELRVFAQILDAVKNSSQFMKRVVVSLFNGMEIDCINDVIRNLEDAAVHPIVIEQFLVIVKERNKEKSSFARNLLLTNPLSTFDDWQNNHNESTDLPKTNDNLNSFKHAIGFNHCSMETRNIQNNKADEHPRVLHLVSEQITRSSDHIQQKMNLNIECIESSAHPIHNRNSSDNEALENELPSGQVQCEMILEKHIAQELKNKNDNLAICETAFENKSHLSQSSLTLPSSTLQEPTSEDAVQRKPRQNCQATKENSLVTEHCQSNDIMSDEQSNTNECLLNSISSSTTTKNNNSESNTDKDISFLIPHDADINNEVVDLSSVQKLTSVTLKNEDTGEIFGFQIESNCHNCLRLNSIAQERSKKINPTYNSVQSSITNNKSSGKLQNFNDPTSNRINLTKNFKKGDPNTICHCRKLKDHNEPHIESHHIPCELSLDAVNAVLDSQIQSNYNQLGLIDSEEKTFRHIPEKTIPTNGRILNKRPRPSKLSATSKSPVKKANNSSKSGGKTKKSFDKIVSENKKASRHNKQGSVNGGKNTESSDSEKSDYKVVCPVCIQLQGKCSCLNCTNCITNLKKHKKITQKPRKKTEKLMMNIISPRQSGSPKRSKHTGRKYSVRKESNPTSKELSSHLTPVVLESGMCFDSKNIDRSQEIVQNNEKSLCTQTVKNTAFVAQKSKLKPILDPMSSSDSNNNDGLINHESKLGKNKKLLQDAASDSDNLKVEDKLQNTATFGDITACKSTETQDPMICDELILCENSKTLCDKEIIVDKTRLLLPKKLDKIAEINTVDKPSVKEAGTLPCFESCSSTQDSSTNYRDTDCDKTNINKESMTGCTEMNDSKTMESQTSEICNNLNQNHQPYSLETISEEGTISIFKMKGPNIFDDDNIIVLHPLNELDHTFFIAKPNCVEKKIIQEKLNQSFNVQVREMTDHTHPSIYKFNQHHKETDKEETYFNGKIVEYDNCIDEGTTKDTIQLNSATSTISYVKNNECEAGCSGGTQMENLSYDKRSSVTFASISVSDSDVSLLEKKEECADLCTNDDECLRICPPLQPELDELNFQCKQDCPKKKNCLELCPLIPQTEPSLQTNLININVILKKFITENNVPNVKLPTVQGLLKELKKVEDSLRAENEKLEPIYEKSESKNDYEETKMKNARKPVEDTKPNCKPSIECSAEGSHRKSVQYEEPNEKVKHIMMNRKSLLLPNVVRGVADMHPSKKLEYLGSRSADPIVLGNYNKPESDRKYSVFNQADPRFSSIDLNDPRTQAHLASIAQRPKAEAKLHAEEESSSDSAVDINQQILTKVIKKTPRTQKPNNTNTSKLNKSRRGMDADSNSWVKLKKRSSEDDSNSMKSFESSDLEPGEFLQVRTPFDNPIKSCRSSGRIDIVIGKISQDRANCNNLCNNHKNHTRSVRNVDSKNTQETSKNQDKTLENKYEICMDSTEAVYMSKKQRSNSKKLVHNLEIFSPERIKPIGNEGQEIIGKSYPEFGIQNRQLLYNKAKDVKHSTTMYLQSKNLSTHELKNVKSSKTEISVCIGNTSLTNMKSNIFKLTERHIATEDSKSPKFNNSHSSKVAKDSHGIINENEKKEPLKKYSKQLPYEFECSNRPQIIDHFLGKTKLEDINIEYTNNKTDTTSKECRRLRGNCQRLYLKSDFTTKTTPADSQNTNIMETPDLSVTRYDAGRFNFSSRSCNEKDLANFNKITSNCWDHMSCDTCSEGEINLPSSCSYSLGEVKISTPSSCTTVGKSFKDLDGLTIFVTKSILDSTDITCASPGEILTQIQKTETDFSSSIS